MTDLVARHRVKRTLPGEQWLRRRPGSAEWQIALTVGGRRLRMSSGTQDKAQAAARAAQEHDRLYRKGALGETATLHLTVAQAAAREGNDRVAIIARALPATTRLADLTDALVDETMRHLRRERDLKPATSNRYVTSLAVLCARARDTWGVQVGPWKSANHKLPEPRGRETFIEHDQARALWQVAVPHLRPILLLEFTTGLRSANVHLLRWEEISLPMRRLVLRQKGDRPLGVDLTADAVALLQSLQPDETKRSGPVFVFGNPCIACTCSACVGKKGQPITSTRRAFQTAARLAGLGGMALRFHDLRHSFASWLLAETGDLRLVQEALGHRNIQTTSRYVHLIGNRKSAAIEAATSGLNLFAIEKRNAQNVA